jgi:hypothetical protein
MAGTTGLGTSPRIENTQVIDFVFRQNRHNRQNRESGVHARYTAVEELTKHATVNLANKPRAMKRSQIINQAASPARDLRSDRPGPPQNSTLRGPWQTVRPALQDGNRARRQASSPNLLGRDHGHKPRNGAPGAANPPAHARSGARQEPAPQGNPHAGRIRCARSRHP